MAIGHRVSVKRVNVFIKKGLKRLAGEEGKRKESSIRGYIYVEEDGPGATLVQLLVSLRELPRPTRGS